MESGVEIRRLRDEDWPAFRSLRLAALTTDPLAFGSTLGRETAYPEAKWREWCHDGATGDRNATLVAVDPSGELVGMVGAFSADGTPHVWGMWIRPDRRGRGLGRRLMGDLLDWIGRFAPEDPILLDVNPQQAAAVQVYAAFGFEYTGIEEPLGHDAPAVTRQMVRRRSSDR